ncbi:Di-/tripeptide transporter [Halomonadaceae bacterium LMG 33818]|uniref:peptide MFS transporter n=1 Tax=Cernens ardua TaxID=3402176 RepID=UPI003EDB8318
MNSSSNSSFLGHPRALLTLCSIEIWERFSFYGMQGILLIYMYYSVAHGGLGIDQTLALGLMGAYSSSVYLSTILGAWCADRVLGNERTLFYSGCTVMCGHIVLALVSGVFGLTIGLVLIALGSGGVKSTTSSILGALYSEDKSRRDAGFSIYYLGVNLGGLIGPALTGILQSDLGFHYGFGLAAIGMACGLFIYARGRKQIPQSEWRPSHALSPKERGLYALGGAVAIIVVALLLVSGGINASNLDTVFFGIIAFASVAYFAGILLSPSVTGVERKQVLIFIPIFIASSFFFALYFQFYTAITVLFDQHVDRMVMGWEVPVAWLSSAESLFIIILSVVFAWLWTRLGHRQPSSTIKFVIALVILAISYAGYIPFVGTGHPVPLWVPVAMVFIFACAEMCISPIGLSLSTKLAPKAFQTQMVALFMLSLALGFAMGGRLGQYYTESHAVLYFSSLVMIGLVTALVLLCFFPMIKRLAPGDY